MERRWERSMDFVYVSLSLLLVGLTFGLVRLCDRV
jgi:hypothetical protein